MGGAAGAAGSSTTNCGPGLQPGAAWPMAGRCEDHRGRSPYVAKPSTVAKWSVPTGLATGPITPGPAIAADGTIYFGSDDKNLYAVHPSGDIAWKFSANDVVRATPAIGVDGTLYFGEGDFDTTVGTNIYAVNPDGTQRWAKNIGGQSASSPAIGPDGTVYIGSQNAILYALDPATGEAKYSFPTDGWAHTSPTVGPDGDVYYGSAYSLFRITPTGGNPWHLAWATEGSVVVVPSGASFLLYAGTGDDYVRWVTPDGMVSSSMKLPDSLSALAQAADGTLYGGDDTYALYAFDLAGNVKWSVPEVAANQGSSPIVSADGVIYISDTAGLHAVSASGELIQTYGSNASSGAAIGADGTVYVVGNDGALYAFGP
jgi:outer membrane protein assembly factor BamB